MALTSLDLRTLEIAAGVAECGSMSQAAARFGLTQSAVSQAVRRVEAVVGAPLLHRDRRPLVATGAGRALVERVRALRLDVERALDAARAAAHLPERLDIRLGLVDSFAGTVGALFIKDLLEGAMALRLTAWSGLSFSHTQALTNHAIDVAVTSDPMDNLADIVRHPILREPFVLVVPRPLAGRIAHLDLADVLASHNLVRHSARSHMGQQIERHLGRLRLSPRFTLEFDTSDVLIAMVATGVGVAITTPLCVLQGGRHIADIVVLPMPGPGAFREILLATRLGEIDDVGLRMANRARDLVRGQILPSIAPIASWLDDTGSGMRVL